MSKRGQFDKSSTDCALPKPKQPHLEKDKKDNCITVQYKVVNTRDFKGNVAVGNTLIISTVGSFSFTTNTIWKQR